MLVFFSHQVDNDNLGTWVKYILNRDFIEGEQSVTTQKKITVSATSRLRHHAFGIHGYYNIPGIIPYKNTVMQLIQEVVQRHR